MTSTGMNHRFSNFLAWFWYFTIFSVSLEFTLVLYYCIILPNGIITTNTQVFQTKQKIYCMTADIANQEMVGNQANTIKIYNCHWNNKTLPNILYHLRGHHHHHHHHNTIQINALIENDMKIVIVITIAEIITDFSISGKR